MATFCTSCGTQLAEGAAFCHSCGAGTGEPSTTTGPESSSPAAPSEAPKHPDAPTPSPAEGHGAAVTAVEPTRGGRAKWYVLGGVVLVGVAALVGLFATGVGPRLLASADSRILVRESRLSGGGSLVLAEPGSELREGLEVARDVSFNYQISVPGKGRFLDSVSLVQTSRGLATSYADEDSRHYLVQVVGEEVEELFDSPYPLSIRYLPEGDQFFIVESTDTTKRCHLVGADGESQRLGLTDECVISPEGAQIALAEVSGNDTDIEVYDVASESATGHGRVAGVISGSEFLGSLQVDDQGNVLAVGGSRADSFDDRQFVTVLDAEGKTVDQQPCDDHPCGGILLPGDPIALRWYTEGDRIGGEIQIELVTGTRATSLHSLPSDYQSVFITGVAEGDVVWLAVLAEENLLLHVDVASGEVDEVASADSVSVFATDEGSTLVTLLEDSFDEEAVFYLGDPAVGELIQLGEFRPYAGVVGGEKPFLYVSDIPGEASVAAVSLEDQRIDPVLEDWHEAYVGDITSDGSLLISGRELEGDDGRLLQVDPSGEIELIDRDVWFGHGELMGDTFYYTVYTDSGFEDPEVRRVDLAAGDGEPEVLWERATLSGTAWSG